MAMSFVAYGVMAAIIVGTALGEVKTLEGLLPICAFCKKIRDDKGCWKEVEAYVSEYSGAKFTHSFCPDCANEHYREYRVKKDPDRGG